MGTLVRHTACFLFALKHHRLIPLSNTSLVLYLCQHRQRYLPPTPPTSTSPLQPSASSPYQTQSPQCLPDPNTLPARVLLPIAHSQHYLSAAHESHRAGDLKMRTCLPPRIESPTAGLGACAVRSIKPDKAHESYWI